MKREGKNLKEKKLRGEGKREKDKDRRVEKA